MKPWLSMPSSSSLSSASSSSTFSRLLLPSPLLQHASCLPSFRSPSSSALSYSCSPSPPTLLPAAPLPSVRGRRPRAPPLRALPARDVIIDFGKFRGCKLGTLPSSYLRWLCRQVSPRYSVWAEYAQEVLQDPYYRDRLEYEMIEKLTMRGNIPKSASPGGETGVKGSMLALGWDLSDRAAWSKVNLSLIGTTAGGRIPRKPADVANNKAPSRIPRVSTRRKAESTPSAASPQPQHPESSALTLQEELMRRRRLRRERASPALSKKESLMQPTAGVFPGRDVLLERLKKKMTE